MILITRPIEESISLAAILESKGKKFIIEPMLAITKLDVKIPEAQTYIVTSRNASSYIPEGAAKLCIPDHGKNAKEVLDYAKANLPKTEKIIYLRGSRITLDIKKELEKDGFNCDEITVYKSTPPAALSKQFYDNFSRVKLATFFSSESYKNFISLVDIIDKSLLADIDALFISDKLVGDTQNIWRNIHIANKPDQNSMVEKIIEIVQ